MRMTDKQKMLAEVLKLKLELVRALNGGTFRVSVHEMIDKLNILMAEVEKYGDV